MLRAKFSSLCARSLGFCISSLVSPESTFLPLHAPVPYSAPHERTAPCGDSVHVLSAPALEMPRAAATSVMFIINGNSSSEWYCFWFIGFLSPISGIKICFWMAEKNYPIKVFYSIFFTQPRWAGGSGGSADSGSGVLARFRGIFSKKSTLPATFLWTPRRMPCVSSDIRI